MSIYYGDIMNKLEYLKKYFGYDSFRGVQEDSINSILNKIDTICIMATGGGKSITFQIPGLIFEGITLVISPLISLMNDQVENLKSKNISAETINSNMTFNQIEEVYKKLNENKIKFLYVSPEKLENHKFKKEIKKINISQIVLDEAHCVSMWGIDFRPSYLKIIDFINELEERPVISCFTATATPQVVLDIKNALKIEKYNLYKSGFDRPNLYYETVHIKDKKQYMIKFIKENIDSCGIIYTLTRKKAEELFQSLYDLNFNVSLYHGGLDDEMKKHYQNEFLSGKTKIMCATNSFGMGIDKPDIRYVINYDLPESLEDLSQQQGRCSRDGKPGICILLYHESDLYINEYFINSIENSEFLTKEEIRKIKKIKRLKLKEVISYATTNRCLHEYLVSYFGDLYFSYCDNCSNCLETYEYIDVLSEAIIILNFIYSVNSRFGVNIISETLCGIKSEGVRKFNLQYSKYFNKIKKDKDFIKEIIINLIKSGYLEKSKTEFPTISTTDISNKLNKVDEYRIKVYSENNVIKNILKPKTLKDYLLDFRDKKSKREGVPSYMVLSEESIKELVKYKPKTKEELLSIKGIGEKKMIKYASEILNIIQKKG